MATKDRTEIALLAVFLATAVGFIAFTTTFRSDSAMLFPRLTGGIVVIGIVLILLEDRLPEPLRRIVAEPVDLVDREEFEEFEPSEGSEDDAVTDSAPHHRGNRSLTSRQFLFAAVAGYVALAYVISILLATPLFVAGYGYWNRQRPLYVVGLIAISVAICLTFVWLANAPVDRGLLLPRGIF